MLTFPEFLSNFNMKNKAKSNIKVLQSLKKIGIHKNVGTYMRDDIFSTNSGIVNLHSRKGTHWVCYVDKYFFDSYGCPPPKIFLNYKKNKYY